MELGVEGRALLLSIMVVSLTTGACTTQAPATINSSTTSQSAFVTVTQDLDIPWALAFLPDGSFAFTERPGNLRAADSQGKLGPEAIRVDGVTAQGEGGLLGLALHPDFGSNHLLYVYHT